MKYFIVAGEVSGDMHGSNLMKQLIIQDAQADIKYWGGDRMAQVHGKPEVHIKSLAFMGFWEVIANLKTIKRLLQTCKTQIEAFEPDALILIDYPGFNLRLAKFAKSRGIKVFYYISPQVWAWKANRVHALHKNCEKIFTIFPFEKAFYAKYGYEVDYVGHPLLDEPEPSNFIEGISDTSNGEKPIALLPGSRKQELKNHLPIFRQVVKARRDRQFILAGIPHLESYYEQISKEENVQIVYNQTRAILKNSCAAVVSSGTATLEAALLKVPQVVVYRGNPISFFIGKQLVKVPFIAMPNLIMEKAILTELIQSEMTAQNILQSLSNILTDVVRTTTNEHYEKLYEKLKVNGASKSVAEQIIVALVNH